MSLKPALPVLSITATLLAIPSPLQAHADALAVAGHAPANSSTQASADASSDFYQCALAGGCELTRPGCSICALRRAALQEAQSAASTQYIGTWRASDDQGSMQGSLRKFELRADGGGLTGIAWPFPEQTPHFAYPVVIELQNDGSLAIALEGGRTVDGELVNDDGRWSATIRYDAASDTIVGEWQNETIPSVRGAVRLERELAARS